MIAPRRTFEHEGKTFDARACTNRFCRREHTLLPCGIALFDYQRGEEGE